MSHRWFNFRFGIIAWSRRFRCSVGDDKGLWKHIRFGIYLRIEKRYPRMFATVVLCLTITGCQSIQSYRMHQLEEENAAATQKMNRLIDNTFEKEKRP